MNNFYSDDIIKTAINEDINYIDAASDLLIERDSVSTAELVAKADGVLSGVGIALRTFELLGGNLSFSVKINDGQVVKKGDVIAEIRGNTRTLLKGERTALNFLQHMSGIATYTNKCVRLVKGTKARITDTRKTLPGLRPLQKYAVTCGGGFNHRYNLSDAAMLKNNHIDAYGGNTAAVNTLAEKVGHMVSIEVETRTLAEVREAAALHTLIKVIMLDNMNFEEMSEAVGIVNGRTLTEASGNITLDNIRSAALTGVDIISIGALTHSVKAFDISMRFV
jgi:nicotinate-nucleotide pyrophosphorylase (carboxylating)